MFDLQAFLKEALESYGFEVVCTRKSVEESPSLYDRAAIGKDCDLLVSLHTNAVSNEVNTYTDYVCVFYPMSGEKRELAQQMSDTIAALMGTKQKAQIRSRVNSAGNADYYGIIRHSVRNGVPALLLEQSFHTHPGTTAWLLDDGNLRRLAAAEAAVIAKHYGMEVLEMRYQTVGDLKADERYGKTYLPTIEKLIAKGYLKGKGGSGDGLVIDLSEDSVRLLVILDRAGNFD